MIWGNKTTEEELDIILRKAEKATSKAQEWINKQQALMRQLLTVDHRVEPEFNMLALAYSRQPGVLHAYAGNRTLPEPNGRPVFSRFNEPAYAVSFEGNTYVPIGPEDETLPEMKDVVNIAPIDAPREANIFGLVFRPSFEAVEGCMPHPVLTEVRSPVVFVREELAKETNE